MAKVFHFISVSTLSGRQMMTMTDDDVSIDRVQNDEDVHVKGQHESEKLDGVSARESYHIVDSLRP